VDNFGGQLDAAAAGAELVELELEPLEELDFSEDGELEELVDSELPAEPFDELVDELPDELVDEALADSRLSLR
jgi:hypothetical protein